MAPSYRLGPLTPQMGKQSQSGGDLPLALSQKQGGARLTLKNNIAKRLALTPTGSAPRPTSFPGPASSSHYPRRGAGPPPRPGLVPENAPGVTRARGPRSARGASQEFGLQILVGPIQPNPGPRHSPSSFPGFARSRHDRLRPRGGDIARIMKDSGPPAPPPREGSVAAGEQRGLRQCRPRCSGTSRAGCPHRP